MEIREAYKREFLKTLKESLAWDDFVTALLKDMTFIQDKVTFKMGNVSRVFNLVPQYVNNRTAILANDSVYVTVDINKVVIKAKDCLLSNDGEIWMDSIEAEGGFYIKPMVDMNVESIQIVCRQFYPDMISCNDVKQVFQVYGLQRDDVKFSSFERFFTATSPYLVNYILKRLNVYYNMEYFYDNGTAIEVTGSKTEVVRKGIKLQRIGENLFYYESNLKLVAKNDYIRTSNGDYPILSVNKNTLTCQIPDSEGEFTIYRSKFITPLNSQFKLKSALEFDFERDDSDLSTRFINRVTPVRCNSGFRGEVDIRVTTLMKVSASSDLPSIIPDTTLKLSDELSFVLNKELSAYLYGLYEDKLKMIDIEYSKYQTDQIILI